MANKTFKGSNTTFDTGMKGTDQRVDFSTMSHFHFQRNAKDTDQSTVGYYLKDAEFGLFQLMRRESPRLSDKIDEGGSSYVLVDNVKEFKLEYYDSNKTEWVKEWDTASVSVLNRLPQAVKIDLTVVEKEDDEEEEILREHVFSTMAPVPLYKSELSF